MTTEKPYALLISGDEQRHLDKIAKFRIFLLDELKFEPINVKVLPSSDSNDVYNGTKSFFDGVGDGNVSVVLVYCGHGGKGSFFPMPNNALPYEEWGRLITSDYNFVFINDSCYSGSSIDSFKKLGLLPQKGLVIASARRDELSYEDSFINTLIQFYRQGMTPRIRRLGREEVTWYRRKVNVASLRIRSTESLRQKVGDNEDIITSFGDIKNIIVGQREEEGVERKDHVQHPIRNGKSLDYILMKK